jgi:hypothetical protein
MDTKKQLKDLTTRFRQWLLEMKQTDLKDMSDETVQLALNRHYLDVDSICDRYCVDPMPPV